MAYDTSKFASLQNLKDTAVRIKKEYLAAISKAGHASFQKASAVPTAEEAQENILYLVKNTTTGYYDIYALVDDAVELLDDTTVSLDGLVTDEELERFEKAGKIIEERTYDTVYGAWKYATIEDGQINLAAYDYLVIGTLESYAGMKKCYGAENLVPIYIEVEDGERLSRALSRERQQEQPKYEEMCRRFLADQKDFSEENLEEAGIVRRYYNDDKVQCLEKIIGEIQNGKF